MTKQSQFWLEALGSTVAEEAQRVQREGIRDFLGQAFPATLDSTSQRALELKFMLNRRNDVRYGEKRGHSTFWLTQGSPGSSGDIELNCVCQGPDIPGDTYLFPAFPGPPHPAFPPACPPFSGFRVPVSEFSPPSLSPSVPLCVLGVLCVEPPCTFPCQRRGKKVTNIKVCIWHGWKECEIGPKNR